MRPILRLLSTRYGAAFALVILLTLVVIAFRGVTGARGDPDTAPRLEPSTTVSVEPTAYDDVVDESPDATRPDVSAPSSESAKTVATRLAEAWLRHTVVSGEQWRAGLAPYVTTSLASRLSQTDPVQVPADTTAGDTTIVPRDALLIEATVPLNAGALRLVLVVVNGAWRVDGLSWDRPT